MKLWAIAISATKYENDNLIQQLGSGVTSQVTEQEAIDIGRQACLDRFPSPEWDNHKVVVCKVPAHLGLGIEWGWGDFMEGK